MKIILFIILIAFVLQGCKKEDHSQEKTDFSKFISNDRLKACYAYRDSTDSSPETCTSYIYDNKWRLTKVINIGYRYSISTICTYEYSKSDILINKKYWTYSGIYTPSINESELQLVSEYKYEYTQNKKIEKFYLNGILTDNKIYTYKGQLLVDETSGNDHILYEYDSNNNLVKETIVTNLGLFSHTEYQYKDSRLFKELIYNEYDSTTNQITYLYSERDNKNIIECHRIIGKSDFLREKETYINGKIVERIIYYLPGEKIGLMCYYRFEYYD